MSIRRVGECGGTYVAPSPEICDDMDNDCDSSTDENCDIDNDDYCYMGMVVVETPSTCTSEGLDCNDNDGDVNPGEDETCGDGTDNNCDGIVDYEDEISCASPPTNPIILYPNGSEVIEGNATIRWNSSTDPNNDFVIYYLEYSNNSGTDWYEIISNYGYENELNDSSAEKELIFSGNENKTIYLRIKKQINVIFSKFSLTGGYV